MKRDRPTLTFYAIAGLLGFGVGLLAPIIKELRSDLGLSYATASLHSSAYAIGFVIAGVGGDRLILKQGRSSVLWLGMAGVTTGIVLLCLGPNLAFTLPGALMVGGMGVFLQSIGTAVLSERNPNHRTTAVGEINAVIVLVGAAAPVLVGAFIHTPLGWRGIAIVALVMFIVLAILRMRADVSAALITPLNARSVSREDKPKALPRAFWAAWLLLAIAVSAEFAALIWSTTFFEDELGASSATAATLSGLFFLAEGIGRMLGGPIRQRVRSGFAMNASLALAAIGFAVFWLSDSLALGAIGYFVTGLGIANLGIFPTSLALSTIAGGHQHDTATTRLAAAIGIAMLLGPFMLAGLADQVGIRNAYLVLPIILVIASVASLFAHRAVERHLADEAKINQLGTR